MQDDDKACRIQLSPHASYCGWLRRIDGVIPHLQSDDTTMSEAGQEIGGRWGVGNHTGEGV